MAEIPKQESQTVKDIYQYYEDTRSDWRRPHLGGSQIGAKCSRSLWYQFHWCSAPNFPGQMLRLFETGNIEEDRVVSDLRHAGIEVYDRDPKNPEQQIRYVDPECGGHFSGSFDGVGKGFKESTAWHLIEIKSTNTKGYNDLLKNGIEKAKPIHYAQIQIYLKWSGLTRAHYFSVCKDNDKYYNERVRYDKEFAETLTAKAKAIIFAPEPPDGISMHGDAWDCKYCDYAPLCKREALPEINCRTCSHSTPKIMDMKGRWDCERLQKLITTDDQKDACQHHIYIPALVPMDVSDADADAGTITYADGTINGPGAVSSREMRCKYEKK